MPRGKGYMPGDNTAKRLAEIKRAKKKDRLHLPKDSPKPGPPTPRKPPAKRKRRKSPMPKRGY